MATTDRATARRMRTERKHNRFAASLLTVVTTMLLLLASCQERRIYSHYESIDIEAWDKSHELELVMPPLSERGVYQEEIGIRYSKLYPYMFLQLIVEQTVFPQQKKYTDTIRCDMMNEHGILKSRGINLSQRLLPLRTLDLHRGDSIHFRIRHNMRRDILPGISDIGLVVSHSDHR